MDWIQGDKFEKIADFTFCPDKKHPDDHSNLRNTLHISDLKPLNLVYTHSFYSRAFFDVVNAISDKQFILVTHNGDTNIDNSFDIPSNVLHWFAQNVACVNKKLESIPIGLENDRWFPALNKKGKMLEMLKTKKEITNILYINHDTKTNIKERIVPYILFSEKQWVTAVKGRNGKDFEGYLKDLYNHQFVICPDGNGIDTHRFWEALYMGTIPVVRRNINSSFYIDLPICVVDEWCEVTPVFLSQEYHRIINHTFNLEMLTFEYWKNKIQNKCLELG